jgi:hypothetical protein
MGARKASATNLEYYESVLFNHARLSRCNKQRRGGTCPHGQERGEEHGDHSEECRAQHRQGNKTRCAHGRQQGHALVDA